MFLAQPALLPSRAPAGTWRAAGPRASVRTICPRRSAWHARWSLQHVRLSQPPPPSSVPSAAGASALRAAALSTEPVVSTHDAELLEWRQCWWPVAFTTDLDASKPSTFTLLGEKLVLWHDGTAWQAFADRCPHRLAPLSEGRVNEDGLLECPYHGWAFSAGGACEAIPQDAAGTARLSPRACATAYETQTAQGMLFVRLEASATPMPLPTVPELDDPAFVYIDVSRDLPYDYSSLLENVLDVSHVPFTHHATVSNRVNGGPVELEVVAPGVSKAGFSGLWQEGPRKGKLGPQHTRFVAPSLMYHSLVAPSLGTTLTVVYGTPTTPGRVRLLARFPFKFNSAIPSFVIRNTPRWVQHQGQNGVLEDDVVFLAVQEQELAATEAAGRSFAQSCFMPLAQDAYVLAFRAWLARFTRGASPWPAGALLSAPRAQSKEELLDRYLSHTVNCVSCMAALRGVRLARTLALAAAVLFAMALTASLVVAALAPASAFASPVAAAVALLASLLGWNKLGAVEQGFIAGPLTPKRNLITKQSTKNASTKIKLV